MILVSFFSEDNVLSHERKKSYIFEYQSNKNRAFRFWGDTRYSRTLLSPIIYHITSVFIQRIERNITFIIVKHFIILDTRSMAVNLYVYIAIITIQRLSLPR